jgi:phosphoglycerol transferase MdoB-like AlkP superfamily enzyme
LKSQLYYITLLLKRLGLVLVIFFILRFLFYLANYSLFGNIGALEWIRILKGGLRFDISAIVYFNFLVIVMHLIPFPFRQNRWYKIALKLIFYLFNIAAIVMSLIDIEYFQYNNKRMTIDILFIVDEGQGMLWQYIKDFWYLLVVLICFIFLIEYVYRKAESTKLHVEENFRIQAIIFSIGILAAFVFVWGSFKTRPLSPINAISYSNIQNVPLVTNTPFTFAYSIVNRKLDEKHYFNQEEEKKNFTITRNSFSQNKKNHPNVVIIILESFSAEFIGSLNNYKGYTPFLDSLIGHSLVFKNSVANAERSNKGIPCIISGIPSLMDESVISSIYRDNCPPGLGIYVKELGYNTSFFHGGSDGTMDFDSYTKKAGLDHYFGRTEFNNEHYFDGHWGIFDEEFFQFFANKINKLPQPFLSVIFTLSSHHPYCVPERYKDKFPEGPGEIVKSLGYADYALRNFFDSVSQKPWFANTLFIITADHPFKIDTHFLPEYELSSRKYAVPLIFFMPGKIEHKVSTKIVQQIDILPSVLDYLGYPGSFNAFGHSVFSDTLESYGYQFRNQIYQIYNSDYILYFDGFKSIGLYNYKKDTLEKENLLNTQTVMRNKLENKIKAIIQEYNHILIDKTHH